MDFHNAAVLGSLTLHIRLGGRFDGANAQDGIGAAAGMVAAAHARAQGARDLPAIRGALLFSDPHPNFKTLQKFQDLTKAYYGKPVSFTLYANAALGEESDYFAYMRRGTGLDFAIVAPANMSALSRIAPFLDAEAILEAINGVR